MYCLHCFPYEKTLIKKKKIAVRLMVHRLKMPKAYDMVYFKNYNKGLAAPFIIYADFEAINEKVYGRKPNNDKSCVPNHIRSIKTVDMGKDGCLLLW